jgi:hypothetical protein
VIVRASCARGWPVSLKGWVQIHDCDTTSFADLNVALTKECLETWEGQSPDRSGGCSEINVVLTKSLSMLRQCMSCAETDLHEFGRGDASPLTNPRCGDNRVRADPIPRQQLYVPVSANDARLPLLRANRRNARDSSRSSPVASRVNWAQIASYLRRCIPFGLGGQRRPQ